jgi:hypothetical protein
VLVLRSSSAHSFDKMKKQERLENKKRKTAALVNMMNINEEDKNIRSKKAKSGEKSSVVEKSPPDHITVTLSNWHFLDIRLDFHFFRPTNLP